MTFKFFFHFLIIFVPFKVEAQVYQFNTDQDYNTLIYNFILTKNEDSNNYITFPLVKSNLEHHEEIITLRIGCSNCYDYLIFKNKNEIEIIDPIDLKKMNLSLNYFFYNINEELYAKYLKILISKYDETKSLSQLKKRKIRFEKKENRL